MIVRIETWDDRLLAAMSLKQHPNLLGALERVSTLIEAIKQVDAKHLWLMMLIVG
jgi:hypothetical protein